MHFIVNCNGKKKEERSLVLFHFWVFFCLFILSNHMEKVFIPSGSFLANDNETNILFMFLWYFHIPSKRVFHMNCKSRYSPQEYTHKTLFQERLASKQAAASAATTLINTNAEKNFSLLPTFRTTWISRKLNKLYERTIFVCIRRFAWCAWWFKTL